MERKKNQTAFRRVDFREGGLGIVSLELVTRQARDETITDPTCVTRSRQTDRSGGEKARLHSRNPSRSHKTFLLPHLDPDRISRIGPLGKQGDPDRKRGP